MPYPTSTSTSSPQICGSFREGGKGGDRDRRAITAIAYSTLIIEVLSPSTAAFDREDKFKFHCQIPTLQEYVLIDGEKVGVDCYARTSAGKWQLTAYPENAADAENPIVELVSLEVQCPLALVYEDVELVQPAG